jgi:hypothetical protein
MKVYLAGGMHGDWRTCVKATVRGPTYLDPREHGYDDPALYSVWDARAVDACDVVFGYLEASNPGGYGLAAEIGRACVQGKLVILVDEQTAQQLPGCRYLALIREWSDIVVDTLEEGIHHLQRMARIYG